MNINDVVSDTVHQFAPTYHSYVLYSNSGARSAPKTVKPKEVFVLPDEPNKFQDNANLLANMELGIHNSGHLRSAMSDQDEGKQQQDDDKLYRANTFSDVEDDFRQGPLEEDEVCLNAMGLSTIAKTTHCAVLHLTLLLALTARTVHILAFDTVQVAYIHHLHRLACVAVSRYSGGNIFGNLLHSKSMQLVLKGAAHIFCGFVASDMDCKLAWQLYWAEWLYI